MSAPGLTAALLLAAAAQSGSTKVATVNGWVINDEQGSCSAFTQYERGIFVRLSYDFGRDDAFFAVTDPAWESVQQGATYRVTVRFTNGSEYTDAEATGLRSDGETGRLTGVLLHLDGSDFITDFAFAGGTALFIGDTRLGALSLGGTKEVATRLSQCAIDSYKRYPPDPFAGLPPARPPSTGAPPARLEPTRAKASLGSLISPDDYPASALRSGEQGVVGFRLSVGPNGRVTACEITSSSGSTALDAATCTLLTARARFTPARGSSGHAVSDTVSARFVWRIPS